VILAKETTKWSDSGKQANHTYLMSDDKYKIFGYFKWHNPKDFMMFKKPISIDKRNRTFEVIKTGIKNI
jgi:hypothetical protein